MEDIDQVNTSTLNTGEGEDISKAFLRLKEHGKYSRTRALRLKENDVIVAVDGELFHESSDNLTDMLSEGPIQGLVKGRAGVFLNNDRIVSVEEAGEHLNHTALTITLTKDSPTATINNSVATNPLTIPPSGTYQGLRGLWIRGALEREVVATLVNDSESDYVRVVTSDNGNFFTPAMVTNEYVSGHNYTPVRLRDGPGRLFEGRLWENLGNLPSLITC